MKPIRGQNEGDYTFGEDSDNWLKVMSDESKQVLDRLAKEKGQILVMGIESPLVLHEFDGEYFERNFAGLYKKRDNGTWHDSVPMLSMDNIYFITSDDTLYKATSQKTEIEGLNNNIVIASGGFIYSMGIDSAWTVAYLSIEDSEFYVPEYGGFSLDSTYFGIFIGYDDSGKQLYDFVSLDTLI